MSASPPHAGGDKASWLTERTCVTHLRDAAQVRHAGARGKRSDNNPTFVLLDFTRELVSFELFYPLRFSLVWLVPESLFARVGTFSIAVW